MKLTDKKRFSQRIALGGALVGWVVIQWVARAHYFKGSSIDFLTMNIYFWQTGEWYFRFLILMNWLVKPLILYGMLRVAIDYLIQDRH